ncbi:acyl-[ACP]--phospholipid O-acyltransferase [Desulfuromonas versatilis]|uniref:Acyl-[ACP]--phospholipid O-acyltransferase n=1 Tax=Desulfuromonas versatilis TaxID=2802975 RepID=A0ABM9SDL5_9BACT|nr:acyl-[ACP]--phospholipid O-acyltransferase [Desulfuromonas versatilis]BCR03611.1 acyl-[ACP]--phospholipid O-acyltransferase [Desulfuromonas versatilis]
MLDHKEKIRSSFAWLNATQFLGVLNDNIFKLFIVFFLIDHFGAEAASRVTAIAGAVFVVPFLALSPLAGRLADRLGKRSIIVAAKAGEVAVMACGALAFILQSPLGLYAALFLMAAQSALFSPAKYGIVPELVSRESLSRANGQLESLTWLAVILGTGLASALPLLTGGSYPLAAASCLAIAAAGLACSLPIRRTRPAGSAEGGSLRPITESLAVIKRLRGDGYLLLAVAGSAWFMFIGAFFQLNLIPFGIDTLGLSQQQGGALFLAAALGIGSGAFLAGRLSGRNIEFGVVPVGALGLTLAAWALAGSASLGSAVPAILLAGLGAGLFIVPLHAFIQWRSPRAELGRILAASNVLGWFGVLAASGAVYLFAEVLGWSASRGFAAIGLLTAALTLAAFAALPDFFLRFVNLLIMRLAYRVKSHGAENVPSEGGALLVANHVSWIDALLLSATTQRRIRFMMEREIYHWRLLGPLFRLMGVIPVSSKDAPRQIATSLRQARSALDDGYLVCIFAEGALTRTGQLGPFKPGLERIVRGSGHPIIPIHIGGLWGSLFSYARHRKCSLRPGPVAIHFGSPLPPGSQAAAVRQAVVELSCAWLEQLPSAPSLGAAFIRSARRHWSRKALADTSGKQLSYGRALAGAIALGRELERAGANQPMIGILLPPSAGGALANLAVTLRGQVPVNLNYTASVEAFRSAMEQCELRTVITSRAVMERFPQLPVGERALFIEDLAARLSPARKFRALLAARCAPQSQIIGSPRRDELATVIFSSGSTGDPKGVMLSHRNLLANIESLRLLLSPESSDNICAALPLFHSFGFTGTLWLPLLCGFSAVYHSNPLEGASIAAAVREHRSTLLMATPTFLGAYLRKASREDFASLRLVITGAEKLKAKLADSFERKFGIRPLEGYGATELAPVTAVNLPDVCIGGVAQNGGKPGSVGRPLPGVAVRTVDPETGRALPPGENGLILVRGANVMRGYLGRPEKTAEALREGWYVTGDIGHLDAEGFLHITDRLARFSKIGGEMVPHLAVEEALQGGLNTAEPAVAVTAVPDNQRGEKLVVIHTPGAGGVEKLRKIMEGSALPNLWRPGRGAYIEVAELPLLGSGKLDLGRLKQIAMEGMVEKAVG